MADQYIYLGTQNLSGKVQGEIQTPGGYFDIKQDGATSLITGARKGDPKGTSVSFSVCFTTQAEASAFLAYLAPYSPEDPDFDEAVGANIPLYIRDSSWHYNVWGVVVKAGPLNKGSPVDYLQYLYDVVCYLYSPYSDGAAQSLTVTETGTLLIGHADEAISAGHGSNYIHLLQYTASASGTATVFRIKCAMAGRVKVAIYADSANEPGNKIFGSDFQTDVVAGWNEIYISAAITSGTKYWLGFVSDTYGGVGSAPAGTAKPLRYKAATFAGFVWPASAGSGYSTATAQTQLQAVVVAVNPVTRSLANTSGHLASSPDVAIACSYVAANPASLTVAIADSESLILATQALSNGVWRMIGDENKIEETYVDMINAANNWDLDTVGDGTFDTDHIELNNGQSAYYRLSGPHPTKKPVRMTADLSLDTGGATGLAYVEISADAVSWEIALTQADFESGATEYVLPGTEFMTDIYVRFRCASGTSGKYLNIGSVMFEVERWIEDGATPIVAAGATKTMTVSATGGALVVSGSFTPRQKFV